MMTRRSFLTVTAGTTALGLAAPHLFRDEAMATDPAAKPLGKPELIGTPNAWKRPEHYLEKYYKQPLVDENVFLKRPQNLSLPPSFEAVREKLPAPFLDGQPDAIACYWKVWELAFRNCKPAAVSNGFIEPYIDTAFNGCLFMWDSAFITLFAKYGARAFAFQKTLDNIYVKQHPDGFMCREIKEWDGTDQFHHCDPGATGPNILPWSEWEYYLNFGDKQRLADVFPPLLAYYRWTRRNRTWLDGSYWNTGWGTGMDNQPRLRPDAEINVDNDHMTWIEANAQAVFAARILLKIAHEIGREADVADLASEIDLVTDVVNKHMWSEELSFYVDRLHDGSLSRVKTIGAFWLLLAGVVPSDRKQRFLAHLSNPKTFGGKYPVPSLSRDDPHYNNGDGGYWCGAVWPPTNYAILRGLTDIGEDNLAARIGLAHHEQVVEVFRKTNTVWEDYAPEKAEPGQARHDFVGWGGLGPVAIFLEYILGLRPDVPANRLVWDIRRTAEFGIKRYPFGIDGLLDLKCAKRASEATEPQVTITSSRALEVDLHWAGGQKTLTIPAT